MEGKTWRVLKEEANTSIDTPPRVKIQKKTETNQNPKLLMRHGNKPYFFFRFYNQATHTNETNILII